MDQEVELLAPAGGIAAFHAAVRGGGVGRALLAYAVEHWDARTLDVNEQNPQAAGFYEHMGFVVEGRSPVDDAGRPFPLLHLRLGQAGEE